jgi:hypothetical protein
MWPRIQKFLQQDMRERVTFSASIAALADTLDGAEAAPDTTTT